MGNLIRKFWKPLAALLLLPASALAAFVWDPLIQSTYFDGIKADMMTTVNGIILVALIIVGLGMLLKVFR